jgi:hypothetical protein
MESYYNVFVRNWRKVCRIKRVKQLTVITLLSFAMTSPMFGRKKQTVEHAPLPAKVLTAKTIYIENDSGIANMADKAYTQLKAWGKYQIVNERERADLVLVLKATDKQVQRSGVGSAGSFNYQTGAWTQSTVPTIRTRTFAFTLMALIDPASGDVAWSDQGEWTKKQSATMELIKDLQQRVEEQQSAEGNK